MAIKIVLVGAGNMGFAMLSGWLKSGKLKAGRKSLSSSRTTACGSARLHWAAPWRSGADALPAGQRQTHRPRCEAASDPRRDGGLYPIWQWRHDVPEHRGRYAGCAPSRRCLAGNTDHALHAEHAGGDRQGHDGGVFQSEVTDEVKAFVADLLAASGEVATIEDEA